MQENELYKKVDQKVEAFGQWGYVLNVLRSAIDDMSRRSRDMKDTSNCSRVFYGLRGLDTMIELMEEDFNDKYSDLSTALYDYAESKNDLDPEPSEA